MKRHSSIVISLVFCAHAIVPAGVVGQDADRNWSLNHPRQVEPPAVKHKERVRNEIDAFVLANLEEKGLALSPEASKRTLIRRIYFDLIGLPPTPKDVETFLNDSDPEAYERLVDCLLNNPRYGERWARLWLDLARYADTAGFEGDPDLPHAWRYRDYVIDSFNNDKPYDLFIKEQIAGDEFAEILGAGDLPGVTPERVVALTFLRLAPFTEPRGDETRHEMLSEMTATVGSVFLGLTVGCAKCHDHKYDEIPTEDFYRMKAFFATVSIPRPEPGDGFQIGGPLPADFYRPGETEWATKMRNKLQREVAEAKAELQKLRNRLEKKLAGNSGFGMQAMGPPFGNNHTFDRINVNDGALHWTLVNSDGKKWQFLTDGAGPGRTGSLAETDEGDWFGDIPKPKHISLGQYNAGSGTPMQHGHSGRFGDLLIYDHPLSVEERAGVVTYINRKYERADTDPMIKGRTDPPLGGLRFWLDASDLDANPKTANPKSGSRVGTWIDKVGGIALVQKTADLRPTLDMLGSGKAPAVLFDDDFLISSATGARFLTDQKGAFIAVYSATHTGEGYGFEVGGDGSFISTFIYTGGKGGVLDAAINDANDPSISPEERQRYLYLADRKRFVPQHLKRLKPVAMSLRHSYGPPYEPGVPTSRVMIRGEYANPGAVVKPGFLSCITGNQEPAKIRLDPFKRWPTRSRRMALANWISSPNNPLTARVMVNRLWHWHFGRGIVTTPSDFGQLSGGPSHPELLDWLANRFVQEKWSIKAMHRLIVVSNAYRQTSRLQNRRVKEVDPDNKLIGRFRSRRLEAEAIRDSVLAVSGRLNSEQFGLPIFPPLPGDLAERVKYSNSKWDTQYGPEGRKRSIYIYQQRTLTMPFMQILDSLVCDESRPRRRTSITPLQALAMYNGEFVNLEAKHFAARVRSISGDDTRKQIETAFLLALSREPNGNELKRMTKFLSSTEPVDQQLVGLCRILYNSNEFVYID